MSTYLYMHRWLMQALLSGAVIVDFIQLRLSDDVSVNAYCRVHFVQLQMWHCVHFPIYNFLWDSYFMRNALSFSQRSVFSLPRRQTTRQQCKHHTLTHNNRHHNNNDLPNRCELHMWKVYLCTCSSSLRNSTINAASILKNSTQRMSPESSEGNSHLA